MSTTSSTLLRRVTVPSTIDAVDAVDFIAMTDVRNAIYREICGNDDERREPAELLPFYAPGSDETRYLWLILSQDRVVGRVGVDIPHEAGSPVARWLIELVRDAQGQGIGTRAHRLVVRTACAHGRTVLQSWAEHPHAPGERLSAPTGFGSVPLDRAARYYRRLGYDLGQVERKSQLDLASVGAHVDALLSEARQAAVGYRLVRWLAPTPPEHIEGYAWAKSRMSTDTPAGLVQFDEERWDAARVTQHDARHVKAGITLQVTAAIDDATGRLVAFNELAIGADRTAVTEQCDTLVVAEHRGHRLGMLVKCAGLVAWRAIAPDSPRVLTWNAEENRPMLDINEAIGFTPLSYDGAWTKTLT